MTRAGQRMLRAASETGELVVTDNQLIIRPGEDQDAAEIGWLYRKAWGSMVDSHNYYIDCGLRLIAKREQLAREDNSHGKWSLWIKINNDSLGFDKFKAARLMKFANEYSKLSLTTTLNEAVATQRLRVMHGNDNTRGTQGTGENEWHTPQQFIDHARAVLGTIDLDPASSAAAQRVVKAEAYFTAARNGLTKEWNGKVWLNPPYAQPLIAEFVDKMIAEVEARNVKEAIMLTHNYTDTTWFQDAARVAKAICFTRGRIRFVDPEGNLAAPTQGQAFFYFGNRVARFIDKFYGVGFVMTTKT